MSNRQDQPAALRRRIAKLEALLEAEQERSRKAWDGYRDALYECVELRLRLDAAKQALEGDE
jgi:hypothetical protein